MTSGSERVPGAAGGLVVEEIVVRYGGNAALDGVSCAVAPGEILGVIGPNGAGKTTLLRSIMGLQPVDGGRIRLDGRDVTRTQFSARCRLGATMTFQIPRGTPTLTVGEELAAQARGFWHRSIPGSRARLQTVSDVVERLDLEAVVRRRISQLTLGEERRFELARALVNGPSLLLVDEPSSGMSASEATLLASALRNIANGGVAVVLVEHNIPFISALTRRSVVLDAGRLLLEGPTSDVLKSETVQGAYLGRATA
jgi:branched-chain amino acid transport system ATP-binding protein